jgi:hypothetical protein
MNLRLLPIVAAAVLATGAQADSLDADFNIRDGLDVPSGGHIRFDLNADGTIAAALTGFTNRIVGFGFASPEVMLPITDFDPVSEDITLGAWSTSYGVLNSGFVCGSPGGRCAPSLRFRIGVPGEFGSVYEALGSTAATVDFITIDANNTTWAGNTTAVPEPAAGALFAAGLGLMAWTARRRRATPA